MVGPAAWLEPALSLLRVGDTGQLPDVRAMHGRHGLVGQARRMNIGPRLAYRGTPLTIELCYIVKYLIVAQQVGKPLLHELLSGAMDPREATSVLTT